MQRTAVRYGDGPTSQTAFGVPLGCGQPALAAGSDGRISASLSCRRTVPPGRLAPLIVQPPRGSATDGRGGAMQTNDRRRPSAGGSGAGLFANVATGPSLIRVRIGGQKRRHGAGFADWSVRRVFAGTSPGSDKSCVPGP